MTRPMTPATPSASRQRGAALYVAMIMLLLLTLIGVAAMQVASLQQRMATNYNDFALAFQRTEGLLRQNEFELQRSVDQDEVRAETYCLGDPSAWGNTIDPAGAPDSEVRKIYGGNCPGSGSIDPTGNNDETFNPEALSYQLMVAAADRDAGADPTSVVVIETTYLVPPRVTPPTP